MSEQTRRATRLFEIDRLFRRYPGGLSVREIADKTGYSPRTIQRDLAHLQIDNNLPLEDVPGRRYRLMPGSAPLGPVRLTLQEARALLLAARLFYRYADERDLDGISALEKIAEALPDPVGRQVQATADQLRRRPPNKDRQEILRRLTEAWADSMTVTIRYRSQSSGGEIRQTDFDAYLLEPSALGNATYVIGYSHEHGSIRTFKVDRIQQVEGTGRHFVANDVVEILKKLADSWGVVFADGDEHYDVKVVFSPAVASRIEETTWHPSQRLQLLADGSVELEMRLPALLEFIPWVRSWGPEALVIEPEELRVQVAESLARASERYR
ncbi:MAG TPA: WYL domain-containing transcriptional regulator [Tepidiformaceae bacterium]